MLECQNDMSSQSSHFLIEYNIKITSSDIFLVRLTVGWDHRTALFMCIKSTIYNKIKYLR